MKIKRYKVPEFLRFASTLSMCIACGSTLISVFIAYLTKMNFKNLNYKPIIYTLIIGAISAIFIIITKDKPKKIDKTIKADRHILIYSKGYYQKNNVIEDLKTIIKYELQMEEINPHFIYQFLCYTLCMFCSKSEIAKYLLSIKSEIPFDYETQIIQMIKKISLTENINIYRSGFVDYNNYKPEKDLLPLAN